MPHGGTIRVSASNVELDQDSGLAIRPGRYIKVQVADNGSGVEPKAISKIFDPYFTTKSSASGLGLSISYSVVKKHGGILQLESTSPDGSTFAFYLPATDAEPQIPGPTLAIQIFDFNHQRVLVMDDEAAIRDLTSELLGTLGYEVKAVADGAER